MPEADAPVTEEVDAALSPSEYEDRSALSESSGRQAENDVTFRLSTLMRF